jgi:hypothetical protein
MQINSQFKSERRKRDNERDKLGEESSDFKFDFSGLFQ